MQVFFLKVDDESDSSRTQSSCTKSLQFLQVLVALAFKSKFKKKKNQTSWTIPIAEDWQLNFLGLCQKRHEIHNMKFYLSYY